MANLRLHSLNDVKLVGRLTKDPEVRYTTQGTAVCRFRLSVNRRYRDKNSSEWKDDTAFVPCTVWRENADRCGQRLKKGSPVFVEGRLKSKDWVTKEGQKRFDLEVDVSRIQFLESMADNNNGEAEASPEESAAEPAMAHAAPVFKEATPASEFNSNEEEVPF